MGKSLDLFIVSLCHFIPPFFLCLIKYAMEFI